VYTFIPHSVLDTLERHFYSIRLTIYWKKSTWGSGEFYYARIWLVSGGAHHYVKPEPNIGLDGVGPRMDSIVLPTIDNAVGPETWYFWFEVDGIWTRAVTESTGPTSFPIWVYAVEVTIIYGSPTVTRTYCLHPVAGTDTTDSPYTLSDGDLYKLSKSDDHRYDSKHEWDTTFSDNEYIEFLFPKIPSTATVSSVKIKVEWARQEKVNAARLRVYDGDSWTEYTLALAPAPTDKWGADTTQEVDISAFIDTAAKFNALKVWFQATVSATTGDRKTRHDLMELTVTYTINVLHPNAGKDTTDALYTLTDDDLIMLAVSDDYRYITKKDWKESFDSNEYVELEFPDITIPSGATISEVLLKFEWQRPATVDNAQLKIYVGTSLIATISLTPLPDPNTDRTEIINLKSYGIDTVAEINALKIWFQATDGKGAITQHDWVEVQVTYYIAP
jgi:hypothetical protein